MGRPEAEETQTEVTPVVPPDVVRGSNLEKIMAKKAKRKTRPARCGDCPRHHPTPERVSVERCRKCKHCRQVTVSNYNGVTHINCAVSVGSGVGWITLSELVFCNGTKIVFGGKTPKNSSS